MNAMTGGWSPVVRRAASGGRSGRPGTDLLPFPTEDVMANRSRHPRVALPAGARRIPATRLWPGPLPGIAAVLAVLVLGLGPAGMQAQEKDGPGPIKVDDPPPPTKPEDKPKAPQPPAVAP